MTLDFSLRFFIVLGSILVPFWPPKWSPGGAAELRKSALRRSKTIPRSSCFGPFFVLSFGIAFFVLWGSFWGRFGCSWGRFGAFLAFQLIDSTHQLIHSSIQPVNSSTHQFNSSTQLRTTNVGTLRRLLTETCLRFPGVRCCFVLVNSSTRLLINPWPFGTFQPGPADCALRD